MVVSLKWAKRLKKAGWPQDGDIGYVGKDYGYWQCADQIAAPFVTELLEKMPGAALTLDTNFKWVVFRVGGWGGGSYISDWHHNPADACAEAWILENTKL